MQENVALLNEINDLRRELSSSKSTVNGLQATLRTTKKLATMRGRPIDEAQLAAENAPPPTLADTLAKHSVERIMEMQKDEIRRLREELGARPPSGRLPSLTLES